MTEGPIGFGQAIGIWLDPDTIAWPADIVPGDRGRACCSDGEPCWELYYAAHGGLRWDGFEVRGADGFIPLTLKLGGLSPAQRNADPYLTGTYAPGGRDYLALTPVAPISTARLSPLLCGDLMVAQRFDGEVVALSELQTARLLDTLYADAAERTMYGPVFSADGVTISVWAPTARRVSLRLFDSGAHDADFSEIAMERLPSGVWQASGPREWTDREYLYEVEVYVPYALPRPGARDQEAMAGTIQQFLVTDPYATGLTIDGARAVVVDLADPAYMPQVWQQSAPVRLDNPSQHAIYELHVRDFSMADSTVPEELRGTYAAFACHDSAGHHALAELRQAGMNTIHLLPTYDHGSIPERRSDQQVPDIPQAAADSRAQQAAVSAVKDQDGYNWGYDPVHYGVPEGSYARDGHQDGGARVAEFRQMVGELHAMGYRVVLDQVFNHTFEFALDQKSVFEKIVPGYYYRLGYDGETLITPCSGEFATEHRMAEKLMIDLLVRWVCDYRVDGFRFDLMEFHSVDTMGRVRAALDAAAPAGNQIYLYGEGWNYGTTANGSRFQPAVQGALGGWGIGTFNDRIRDAVRGGQSEHPADTQGFGSGLYVNANGRAYGDAQLARHYADVIRIGLAGNLRAFEIISATGDAIPGEYVSFNGQPTGYGTEPHDSINYVDAHDNETLYDLFVWKLPTGTPMDVRVRMNTLALATVALGQSPMFWHAGTDLLRSKSLDADSYNSGDWFNAIDWTGNTTRFGVGLPPAHRNEWHWEHMRPMLANPANKPLPEHVHRAHQQALDLLRLRQSSPLFTLGSAELIREMVSFPNAGPHAIPGVIVMRIHDWARRGIDARLAGLLVAFNTNAEELVIPIEGMEGTELTLSPVQQYGGDDVVVRTRWDPTSGKITIPARTVAVMEQTASHDGSHGPTLSANVGAAR